MLYLLKFGLIEPFIGPKTFRLTIAAQSIKGGRVTAKKLVKFILILLLFDISLELKHLGQFFI